MEAKRAVRRSAVLFRVFLFRDGVMEPATPPFHDPDEAMQAACCLAASFPDAGYVVRPCAVWLN